MADGAVRQLAPAPMALMRALARRSGRVVSREDLLAALPGGGEDTHAVETGIARLRAGLGTPKAIQTVVKRGYRLALGPAECMDNNPSPPVGYAPSLRPARPASRRCGPNRRVPVPRRRWASPPSVGIATFGGIYDMSGSKKYSVSLPEDLAESVRDHVGPGGFSACISEALEQRVARDKLGEIVADYAKDHDPLSPEEIESARAALRHDKNAPGAAA